MIVRWGWWSSSGLICPNLSPYSSTPHGRGPAAIATSEWKQLGNRLRLFLRPVDTLAVGTLASYCNQLKRPKWTMVDWTQEKTLLPHGKWRQLPSVSVNAYKSITQYNELVNAIDIITSQHCQRSPKETKWKKTENQSCATVLFVN